MNIFLLSHERRHAPRHFVEQAYFHCDKHVIKMIAESTQMLVTSLSTPDMLKRYPGMLTPSGVATPCRPLGASHAKHPCMLWTASSIEHTYYLLRLALALCTEKHRRWPLNPSHEYESWLLSLANQFSQCGFAMHDPLPESFPIAIKDARGLPKSGNQSYVVNLYRDYYVTEKASFATWRYPAREPVWFILRHEQLKQLKLHELFNVWEAKLGTAAANAAVAHQLDTEQRDAKGA